MAPKAKANMRATVASRTDEATTARAALDALEAERAAALTEAAAEGPSGMKMAALEALDGKIASAKRTLEVLGRREENARAELERLELEEKRAALAALLEESDSQATYTRMHEELVAPVMNFAREFDRRVAAMRGALAAQREGARRARELAAEIGETIHIEDVHADDVRVLTAVAVGAAVPTSLLHLFAEPIAAPYADGYALHPHLGSEAEFTTARRVLAAIEGDAHAS